MHGTYLLGSQRFAKQINCRHLAAKYSLLVQFGCCTNIALIEGLQKRQRQKKRLINTPSTPFMVLQVSIDHQSFNQSLHTNTHIICRHKPRHLCTGRQLTIDQALDFTLRPPIVNVHDGDHVPLARLELVLDAMLEPLAFHLHRRQHQAVAYKVRRVADAFGRFETEKREIIKTGDITRRSRFKLLTCHQRASCRIERPTNPIRLFICRAFHPIEDGEIPSRTDLLRVMIKRHPLSSWVLPLSGTFPHYLSSRLPWVLMNVAIHMGQWKFHERIRIIYTKLINLCRVISKSFTFPA